VPVPEQPAAIKLILRLAEAEQDALAIQAAVREDPARSAADASAGVAPCQRRNVCAVIVVSCGNEACVNHRCGAFRGCGRSCWCPDEFDDGRLFLVSTDDRSLSCAQNTFAQ
jgi:hypothetical protein